jgi:hypothetical protein
MENIRATWGIKIFSILLRPINFKPLLFNAMLRRKHCITN